MPSSPDSDLPRGLADPPPGFVLDPPLQHPWEADRVVQPWESDPIAPPPPGFALEQPAASRIDTLRAAGFSNAEIDSHISEQHRVLRAAGFSDAC